MFRVFLPYHPRVERKRNLIFLWWHQPGIEMTNKVCYSQFAASARDEQLTN